MPVNTQHERRYRQGQQQGKHAGIKIARVESPCPLLQPPTQINAKNSWPCQHKKWRPLTPNGGGAGVMHDARQQQHSGCVADHASTTQQKPGPAQSYRTDMHARRNTRTHTQGCCHPPPTRAWLLMLAQQQQAGPSSISSGLNWFVRSCCNTKALPHQPDTPLQKKTVQTE